MRARNKPKLENFRDGHRHTNYLETFKLETNTKLWKIRSVYKPTGMNDLGWKQTHNCERIWQQTNLHFIKTRALKKTLGMKTNTPL